MPTGRAEDTDLDLVPIRSEVPLPLLTALRRKEGREGTKGATWLVTSFLGLSFPFCKIKAGPALASL